MGLSLVLFIFMALLTVTTTVARVLPKRNIDGNYPEFYDYEDYPGKDEQYPVATKRAALLLDRLMVALQKAVDEQGIGSSRNGRTIIEKDPIPKSSSSGLLRTASRKPSMDLQRRGHSNGGVYWRCYFNAVTCFKKK